MLAAGVPVVARAQSSQFGVRGLGLPSRWLGTEAFSTGGAFGMFDAGSALDPAALGSLTTLTAGFSGLQDFRHEENPAGSRSLRDTRFPLLTVGGPVHGSPAAAGISFSNYTSRDFTLASADTV